MKILLAAGGSGGHIYPGLSIIEAIEKIAPETEFLWVGTYKGREKEVAQSKNISYVPVKAWSINNEGFIWKIQAFWFHGLMTLKLMAKMKREKIDAVVTTGGYATASSLMAATLLGIPIFMHEQNVYPGLGTRKFGKFAKRIFTSFPGTEEYLPGMKEKISLLGNPIRDIFSHIDREEIRKKLDVTDKILVVSIGGSLGAQSINGFIRSMIPTIENRKDLYWVHVVGMDYEEELKFYKDKKNMEAHLFLHDLPSYLVASDLLISRSGASTLTEISSLGRASILIPSSNVLDDHQMFNAKLFSDKKAAIIIEDSQLSTNMAQDTLVDLLVNEEKRKELALRSKGIAPLDGAENIALEILELL
ncbi:MAG: UDP-N-acetylglucosamine--N-acetylmuramyl-(pentapeptide) pyrophosphoryl-undecaprenol N-acetylglucosamine transferase [Tissierellia bacterium]|nr:UDP-N-acetylglucosamine--N-acetylmuramyl-(pentapeptide) pyrophosphoryl-undecaprenol N-acetylglucosamine transferase [Tissierellia bacterium]